MTEIEYWGLEEALRNLINSRNRDEENWHMSRRARRWVYYLLCDERYYNSIGGGGGSGSGGSSGREGTKESGNGVYAMNDNAQKAITANVENDYAKYIKFDENGKVNIEIFDMEVIKILENNPESNFAKLCALVYNAKEVYKVYGLGSDDRTCEYYKDSKDGWTIKKRTFSEMFDDELVGDGEVGGLFVVASIMDGRYPQCCDRDNPSTIIYINMNLRWDKQVNYEMMSGYAAHELYYHLYNYNFNNNNYRHPGGFDVPGSREYKNATHKR